jgi:tRNA-2-methylthio-N6-dimethylallyladenosine synthase
MNNTEIKKTKIFLQTYGCQMNVRDSEVVSGLLAKEGYKIIDKPDDADIILFNTCSVRQHAEDKVWSEVGRLAKAAKGKKPLIGVIGCMAQNYKELIFERATAVDFVVGPSDIDKIPQIIKKLAAGKFYETKIWETDGAARPDEIYHTGFYDDKKHAFVVISEGCSNYCSYCVVPYVRGELHHRGHKTILKEIEEAVGKGITSVTLLGQNVNAYNSEVDFAELLRMVNTIDGLKEFSFVTSHPKDTSLDLFKAMAGLDKLTKSLHLPIQSGSDRILKLMNRGYTRKFYLDLTDNYRKIVKGACLTTDIIVGFPTETQADFEDTYSLLKDIEFDSSYIFKYSPRPNTQAANLPDDVEQKEKEKRHKTILDLQKEISRKKKCLKK